MVEFHFNPTTYADIYLDDGVQVDNAYRTGLTTDASPNAYFGYLGIWGM
jgi:hypothetical protein